MESKELIEKIAHAKEWLHTELSQISTGRANPALLDSIQIDVYGVRQPIKAVASTLIEDARTLRLSPWDKSQIKVIEQAITDARLPVSISTDDQGLRIHVPALTEETRQSLVKLLKEKLEQARVRIRAAREEAIKELGAAGLSEDEVRDGKENVQELIDKGNQELQEMFNKKETEVSTI